MRKERVRETQRVSEVLFGKRLSFEEAAFIAWRDEKLFQPLRERLFAACCGRVGSRPHKSGD